jgi:uncharacterized protein YecT (DUF1311 family)
MKKTLATIITLGAAIISGSACASDTINGTFTMKQDQNSIYKVAISMPYLYLGGNSGDQTCEFNSSQCALTGSVLSCIDDTDSSKSLIINFQNNDAMTIPVNDSNNGVRELSCGPRAGFEGSYKKTSLDVKLLEQARGQSFQAQQPAANQQSQPQGQANKTQTQQAFDQINARFNQCASAADDEYSDEFAKCEDNANKAVDKILNQNYKRMMNTCANSEEPQACKDSLKTMQRAWLKYRDAMGKFVNRMDSEPGNQAVRLETERQAGFIDPSTWGY